MGHTAVTGLARPRHARADSRGADGLIDPSGFIRGQQGPTESAAGTAPTLWDSRPFTTARQPTGGPTGLIPEFQLLVTCGDWREPPASVGPAELTLCVLADPVAPLRGMDALSMPARLLGIRRRRRLLRMRRGHRDRNHRERRQGRGDDRQPPPIAPRSARGDVCPDRRRLQVSPRRSDIDCPAQCGPMSQPAAVTGSSVLHGTATALPRRFHALADDRVQHTLWERMNSLLPAPAASRARAR